MSLNYDLVSNYQSPFSNQAYDYLAMEVQQIKNFADTLHGCIDVNRTIASALWEPVNTPTDRVVPVITNYNLKIPIVSHYVACVNNVNGINDHNNLFINKTATFNDLVFEGLIEMPDNCDLTCQPELNMRFADLNNRYLFALRGAPINDVFFRRYQEGKEYNIGSFPFNFQANKSYEFKIVALGKKIDLWLNDSHVISYTDNDSKILSGYIGIGNYRNQKAASFGDIYVLNFNSNDLNMDGFVNFVDFALLTKNGVSDLNDLSVFMNNWLYDPLAR
jgi:hypothetical protein